MFKPCDAQLSSAARKHVPPDIINVCRGCGVSSRESRAAGLRIYTDVHEGVFWAMCCGCDGRNRAVGKLAIAVDRDRSLSRNYELRFPSEESSSRNSDSRSQFVILPTFTRQWHVHVHGDGRMFKYKMVVRSDALPVDRHLPYLAKHWKRRPLSFRGFLAAGESSRLLTRLRNVAVEFRVMRNVLVFDATLGRHAWPGLSCGVKELVRAKLAGRGRKLPSFCSARLLLAGDKHDPSRHIHAV